MRNATLASRTSPSYCYSPYERQRSPVKRSVLFRAAILSTLLVSVARAHPGSGLVVDREGRLYFVVIGQNYIMRVDTRGDLTTFVSDPRLRLPHHLVVDQDGNIYTASDHDGIVWKIAPDGTMMEYFSSRALWRERIAIVGQGGDPFTLDEAGNLYCIAYSPRPDQSRILRITPEGVASTIAGSGTGYADGVGQEAKFADLHFASMAWGPAGLLYVTDRTRVRTITPDGIVSTWAIRGGVELEYAMGITVDSVGNVYVADYAGHRVTKTTPGGETTTVLGRRRLFGPTGVAIGPAGETYVLDSEPFGTRVWKIGADGQVMLLASVRRNTAQLVLGAVVLLVFPLLLVLWLWQRKSRGGINAVVWSTIVGVLVVLTWLGAGALPSYSLRYVLPLRHVILIAFIATAVRAYLRGREAKSLVPT